MDTQAQLASSSLAGGVSVAISSVVAATIEKKTFLPFLHLHMHSRSHLRFNFFSLYCLFETMLLLHSVYCFVDFAHFCIFNDYHFLDLVPYCAFCGNQMKNLFTFYAYDNERFDLI